MEFPNLGYAVNASFLQTVVGDRLLLSFETIAGMKYKVALGSRLGDEDMNYVKFATTKDGLLNSSRLTGHGGRAKIYLKPSGDAGFIKVIRE